VAAVTDDALRSVAAAPAPPRWYTHRLNRPSVYRVGAMLAGALPRSARLALARGLAGRAAGWFPAERARVLANVAHVRPHASPAEREALVADVFRHFAICFADLISTNRSEAQPDRLVIVGINANVIDGLFAAVQKCFHLPCVFEVFTVWHRIGGW